MNKRERMAEEVLAAGGVFRKMLERNYYGHEKFEMRLLDKNREIVKGVGFAAWLAMEKRGLLERKRGVHYGSACVEEWELARVEEKASA